MIVRSIATASLCAAIVLAWRAPGAHPLPWSGLIQDGGSGRSALPPALLRTVSDVPLADEEGGFSRVHFRAGTADLKRGETRKLDKQVRFLKRYFCMTVFVQGWTDWTEVPTLPASMWLGLSRALAVKKYLVSKGIAGERIVPRTYGWILTPKFAQSEYRMANTQDRHVDCWSGCSDRAGC